MKTYINRVTGELFAYESDGSQDDYIPSELELLSDEELMAIRADQEAASAPTPEQALDTANARRDELLAKAALRVAPLQDAIDIGRASQGDKDLLLAWKSYRVDLNEVGLQSGFPSSIKWPSEPA